MVGAVFSPSLGQVAKGVLPGNGQDDLKLVFSVSLPPSELARLAGAGIEVWSNIPTYGKGVGEWGATPFEEPDEATGGTRLSGFDCIGESPSSQGEAPLKRLFATFTVPARPADYSFTYRIRFPDYYQWLGQSWNNGTVVIPSTPAFVRTHEPTGIAGVLSTDVAWKGWAWRDVISEPPIYLSLVDHIESCKTVLLAPSSTLIPDLPLILLQSSIGMDVNSQVVTSLDADLRVTLLQEIELQTSLMELGSNFLSNPGADWIAFTSTRRQAESYRVYPRFLTGISTSVVLEAEMINSLLPPNIESYTIVSEDSNPICDSSKAPTVTTELDIGTYTVVGLRSVPGSENLLAGIPGAGKWVETTPVPISESPVVQTHTAEPTTRDDAALEPNPPAKAPSVPPTLRSGSPSGKNPLIQPVPIFSRFLQDSKTSSPPSLFSSIYHFIVYILALLAPFIGHYFMRIGLARFTKLPTPIMPTPKPQPAVVLPQEADDTATESVESAPGTPKDSAKPNLARSTSLVGKASQVMNAQDLPPKKPALIYEVIPENGTVDVFIIAKKTLYDRPHLAFHLDGVLATIQCKPLAQDVWVFTLSREKLGSKSLLEISTI